MAILNLLGHLHLISLKQDVLPGDSKGLAQSHTALIAEHHGNVGGGSLREPLENRRDFVRRNVDVGRRPGLELLVPRAWQGYVAHGRIPDHFLQHGIFEALGQNVFDY